MEGHNIQFQTIYSPTPLYTYQALEPQCYDTSNFSNSVLENLINLQKAPFIIQEQESSIKKINSPETTCEKFQQKIIHYNRKQKSLQQLSKKFLNQFQGKNISFLELDKVTQSLSVQKRRIYDIINILQSLKVVTKNGKNNYKWKGLTQAVNTINQCQKDINSLQIQSIWKQKSLQFLASGLLKLFLHWKNVLSLEEAAKQIIKQLEGDSLRTKIRRLYDIINVFKSLRLVKKTTLPNRKPGFKWLGTQFLEEYIRTKSLGDEIQEESFESFKLEDQKFPKTPKMIQKDLKPSKPQSFFLEILEKKLGIPNMSKASQILQNQIWPLSRNSSQKREKQNQGEMQNEEKGCRNLNIIPTGELSSHQ